MQHHHVSPIYCLKYIDVNTNYSCTYLKILVLAIFMHRSGQFNSVLSYYWFEFQINGPHWIVWRGCKISTVLASFLYIYSSKTCSFYSDVTLGKTLKSDKLKKIKKEEQKRKKKNLWIWPVQLSILLSWILIPKKTMLATMRNKACEWLSRYWTVCWLYGSWFMKSSILWVGYAFMPTASWNCSNLIRQAVPTRPNLAFV